MPKFSAPKAAETNPDHLLNCEFELEPHVQKIIDEAEGRAGTPKQWRAPSSVSVLLARCS
jgi:hypothetical protein